MPTRFQAFRKVSTTPMADSARKASGVFTASATGKKYQKPVRVRRPSRKDGMPFAVMPDHILDAAV